MTPETGERRGMALHNRILLGLLIGALLGVITNIVTTRYGVGLPVANAIIDYVATPIGQVFLRMLFMVVVPLVFTTLALGVAGLGDLRKLGRIGGKTLAFFVFTTGLAAALGLVLVNLVEPGNTLDPAVRTALMEQYATDAQTRVEQSQAANFGIQTFINIVTRNPLKSAVDNDMLGLIFFTLIFGVALTRLPAAMAEPVIKVLEGVAHAVIEIIGFAMRLAPYGVTCLIFSVTARFGMPVLRSLGLYVIMVLIGLIIHQFGVMSIIARTMAGISPREFFRKAKFMMITAFSTSSSNATLPTTLRTAEEEFGVPRQVAGFVIPLGATMNMNGTALFEGMTVLFLAQVFGVTLSIGTQAIVMVMAIITAIGAAGVPSGSIPLLVMVLAMVGVPPEGIALILGVDRILDMSRTVPNVTCDLLASIVVAKSEGYKLVPATAPDFSSGAALEALAHEHEVETERAVASLRQPGGR
jgi:dicarboxylate/amino acid:cation (Na+ or H+) symporter, DAACS family